MASAVTPRLRDDVAAGFARTLCYARSVGFPPALDPPPIVSRLTIADVGPSARGGRTLAFVQGGEFHPEIRYVLATPKAVWDPKSFPIPVKLGLPRSRDLGADTDGEVAVALRTWGEVSCTAFRATLAGTVAAPAGDDGTSGVYWHDTAWPPPEAPGLTPGALAETLVRTDVNGIAYDADVHVNGKDFVWSLDGRPGTVDARSVLVHELGHFLGLGHSTDPIATMYASKPAGLGWRSLESDDVAGVCFLYPGTGDLGCPATPCPSGLSCVAKRCERVGTPSTVCSPCERVAFACDGAGSDARCIDLPGGRVCGRACEKDGDCGPGFHCKPTSQAGDLQCVSDDGCASGPFPCSDGGACPSGSVCAAGACVGIVPKGDAGPDASDSDAGAPPPGVGGGGCSCNASARDQGAPYAIAAGLLLLVLRRRRSQEGAPGRGER